MRKIKKYFVIILLSIFTLTTVETSSLNFSVYIVQAKASSSTKRKAQEAYRKFLTQRRYRYFTLWDIDKDGLKELLVTDGREQVGNSPTKAYAYTYTRGKLRYAGEIGSPMSGISYNCITKRLHASSWRNEQTAGMDIQGNTYANAIEYSFVTDPFGTEEYSTCDAWYLGKNYSRLTGSWYFPADQIQDGFAHIRLIGDGNVIYDNSELNADNCRIDFDIDVSGVRELNFEYNGICDITDILFGMSDAKLHS